MSFTRELYKLGFEISPVILCDGVAQSIPGGMLPIVALTQSASYVSGLMGGAIELTDLDKYFCHWRAGPVGQWLITTLVVIRLQIRQWQPTRFSRSRCAFQC
nr:hypothetical protein [Salmonella enterica]